MVKRRTKTKPDVSASEKIERYCKITVAVVTVVKSVIEFAIELYEKFG
ncbi:MAG TPA: hypothetical protein VD794_14620 [Flavisolibacter sp.]|nr:hypothetical protein [Flavisolibacter sp.]